jgi:hypothetical protein
VLDHKKHRDTFVTVIKQLGGTPVAVQKQYDLSSYLKAGEGDSTLMSTLQKSSSSAPSLTSNSAGSQFDLILY